MIQIYVWIKSSSSHGRFWRWLWSQTSNVLESVQARYVWINSSRTIIILVGDSHKANYLGIRLPTRWNWFMFEWSLHREKFAETAETKLFYHKHQRKSQYNVISWWNFLTGTVLTETLNNADRIHHLRIRSPTFLHKLSPHAWAGELALNHLRISRTGSRSTVGVGTRRLRGWDGLRLESDYGTLDYVARRERNSNSGEAFPQSEFWRNSFTHVMKLIHVWIVESWNPARNETIPVLIALWRSRQ